MNFQYLCSLYFNKSASKWEDLIRKSLSYLGFVPSSMTIYVHENRMLEDVTYDENLLYSILPEHPLSITIMNQEYEENGEHLWFRIKNEDDRFISLVWSNKNLDFLLSESIVQFLNTNEFVAGYAFNNKDVSIQNTESKGKNELEPILFPGQCRFVCGMKFMAAPIMWFGNSFFEIISKEKLLKFNYSHLLTPSLVEVKLFDLYESPSMLSNREKQKAFWIFFDLTNVISMYKKKHEIDAVQSLRDFLARKR